MNTDVEIYTDWRDYYELTKPRVVMLIVFTAIVGMFLSVPGWPGAAALFYGTLGIGLAASSAAVFNHVSGRQFVLYWADFLFDIFNDINQATPGHIALNHDSSSDLFPLDLVGP